MPTNASYGPSRVSKPHHSHRHSPYEGRPRNRDASEEGEWVHNNYGRVSQDRYNYNINVRSSGDNNRSRNWNGNVFRDRNFGTYVKERPKRDRSDNRRYSRCRSSSRMPSETPRACSFIPAEYRSGSCSVRPIESIENSRECADGRSPESYRERAPSRDLGDDDEYYGARQAYRDISRGDTVQGRMRPTDRVRDSDELRIGTIISTAVHEQARENTVSIDEFNKSLSGFGVVYSKYRKMIIIEEWAQHVVCIPLYSYNGRGLVGRESLACEYFDVRDVDDQDPEKGDTFSMLKAVRDQEWPRENTFIEGRTVAKLTEKITFFRNNKCSIEGKIVQDSLGTLIPPYVHSTTNPLVMMVTRSQTDSDSDDGVEIKEEPED